MLFVSATSRFFLRLLLEDDTDDEVCKRDDDDGRIPTTDVENEFDTAT